MATGTYKPQIHLYNFSSLSLSFARHTDIENLTFEFLSNSWTKSVHLQIDRSLEFHTPMGMHHKIRIPHYGRDLVYCPQNAELLVPAEGREIYRVNLERGNFMKPLEADENVREVLCGAASSAHGLLAFGTDAGTTELVDPRSRSRIGTIGLHDPETITATTFDPSGLTLATGSSAGLVRLYDLRSPVPLLTKDQGYSYEIKKIIFLPSRHGDTKVLSADRRIIKIWSPTNGKPWTSIEPSVDINDIVHLPDTGMLLTANEGSDMHTFFIPELGPAPKWCSFLDNLTEEMEESAPMNSGANGETVATTYDNYKFLTKPQLEELSLSHLVGSSVLRPYMHGFFVKQELYEQARLIANPWGWEQERKKLIQAKIDKEREGRIRSSGKKLASKVKVNQKLAERLLKLEDKLDRRSARKAAETDEMEDATEQVKDKIGGVLEDDRFKDLFSNPDFTVDETSHQFMLHNPSTRVSGRDGDEANGNRRKKTAAEDEDEASSRASSGSDSESETEAGNRFKRGTAKKTETTDRYGASTEPNLRISTTSYQKKNHQNQNGASRSSGDQSFGSRLANGNGGPRKSRDQGVFNRGVGGEMELTWKVDKKKPTGPQFDRNEERGGKQRRDGRRSASGNAFRRMGV